MVFELGFHGMKNHAFRLKQGYRSCFHDKSFFKLYWFKNFHNLDLTCFYGKACYYERYSYEHRASKVKNHGKFYLAFMARGSALIEPASMVGYGTFNLAEHGNLHPCSHG